MNILILGANGLVGNEIFRYLSFNSEWNIFGAVRSDSYISLYPDHSKKNILIFSDFLNDDSLSDFLKLSNPDIVINAVGVTKHRPDSENILKMVPINALFPHRLDYICKSLSIRLIHIGTDCVFSGDKGNYLESDLSDARDLYGKSKALGDLYNPGPVTLRTSFIGHEMNSKLGLVEWFLSQKGVCKGYSKAIFSGFPASYFALILQKYIIPNKNIRGLFHIASEPITKFDLLNIIANVYKIDIKIEKDDLLTINRSLNADLFNKLTGFVPPKWPELIKFMHQNFIDVNNV